MPQKPNDPVVQWLDFPAFGKSQPAATNEQLHTSVQPQHRYDTVWPVMEAAAGSPPSRHDTKKASEGYWVQHQQPGMTLGAHTVLRDSGVCFGESGKLATFLLNYHEMISKPHLLAAMEMLCICVQITPQPGGHLYFYCLCYAFWYF